MATALLVFAAATPAQAAGRYNDFDYITSHVNTQVPQTLAITRPSGEITTSASQYYITGTSDPDQPLYLEGSEVTGRGVFGSFGVYVDLAQGSNRFTFSQNGVSRTVTIQRGGSGGTVTTTRSVSQMAPSYDSAYNSGDTLTLECVAPAGGTVTATFAGQSVALQQVAVAQTGVPARFRGSITLPQVSQMTNLGPVQYTLQYGGSVKSWYSAGELYVAPAGETILVQVKNASSAVFADANTTSNFITVAKMGAIDAVIDQTDDRYQLAMGGWIVKDSAQPLQSGTNRNHVSEVTFERQERGEVYTFVGTSHPVVTSSQNDAVLRVEMAHTDGISSLPIEESGIFSSAEVSTSGDSTVLTLHIANNSSLWGYVVEYADGVTTLYCKYRPVLSGDASQPLQGITIALDPGHGGTDPGAYGTAQLTGPTESQITYNTAVAVKKRLESLGATVLMTEQKDSYISFEDRMLPPQQAKVDLFISLHGNATALGANGLKAKGVEVYYYNAIAKPFASTLSSYISSETGRTNRGAKFSYFRVTLNSYAPSVLVEMGFLTNPYEYDNMCSRTGMFNTANAIGDGVVAFLS